MDGTKKDSMLNDLRLYISDGANFVWVRRTWKDWADGDIRVVTKRDAKKLMRSIENSYNDDLVHFMIPTMQIIEWGNPEDFADFLGDD